jgi:hypothetical protein
MTGHECENADFFIVLEMSSIAVVKIQEPYNLWLYLGLNINYSGYIQVKVLIDAQIHLCRAPNKRTATANFCNLCLSGTMSITLNCLFTVLHSLVC